MAAHSAAEAFLILISILISLYFFFLGYVAALLYYYNGALGPEPKRYLILPQYLKEALRLESSSRSPNTHPHQLDPSRWTGNALLDPNIDPDDVDNESLAREIREQKRISRMPAFVQDDCGDGTLFPDVPVINPNDPLYRLEPNYQPRFRENPGAYMTMGLKKLDLRDWLVIDSTYAEFHAARVKLLRMRRQEVVRVLPEAEEACEELLEEVVRFLTTQYPRFFEIQDNGKTVVNKIVGERYSLRKPWDCHPLELCARLAMEDFNILARSEFTGQHRLIASATLFPAGWRLRDRIGKSVTDLHGPVPLWKDLPDVINNLSYFTRLSPASCMQRHSFFIQIQPQSPTLHGLLFIQHGKDFFPGNLASLKADRVIVRRERQTFRRLPKSEVVVFGVKTSVELLVDLPEQERRNLGREIEKWPGEIAEYKGRDLWGKVVLGFCER